MFQIRGINISSNTTKVVYVAEELGIDYEFIAMDFTKGEHKSPDHLQRHPIGKLPTLTHDGRHLFESGAICRYLANLSNPALYGGSDHYSRALVDQWMNFFTCHVGKHFSSYAFESVAKEKYGFGTRNEAAEKEALGFIDQQLPCVNARLEQNTFLAGDVLTIADLYAFAYSENAEMANLPLDAYPAFAKWYGAIKARDSVRNAKKRMGLLTE